MAKENVLMKNSKEVFFVLEEEEYHKGYSLDYATEPWYETEEIAKERKKRSDKNDSRQKRWVISRRIIQLNKKMLKEISDANPLDALKDKAFGHESNEKTKNIFNTLYKFVSKYKNFFDLYKALILLPKDILVDNGKRIQLPLELYVSLNGDDEFLFFMNDDMTHHFSQWVSCCNWYHATTFHWSNDANPPESGFTIYNTDRFGDNKGLTPKTLKEFHENLISLYFDPVANVIVDKEAIFAELHKGKSSWRYFLDGGDYLQASSRGIIAKRTKGMSEATREFVNNVIRNEFMKTYAPNMNSKEHSVTPGDFLDWLEKNPKRDWSWDSFYDFCIENKSYELCEDRDGFGNTERYCSTATFSTAAHDELYNRIKKEFCMFTKQFIKRRKGNNNELVKEFAEEINNTIERDILGLPGKDTIRKERRKKAEEENRRRREEEEAKRWADLDDWD